MQFLLTWQCLCLGGAGGGEVCLWWTVLAVTGANGSSVIVLLLYQLSD